LIKNYFLNKFIKFKIKDINVELDELRRVLPYTDIFQQQKEHNDEKQSKQFKQNNARKLSKINTIILATNW